MDTHDGGKEIWFWRWDLLLIFEIPMFCTTFVLEEACLYELKRKGLILLISNETTIWAGRRCNVIRDFFCRLTLQNNL
jgi:hypothetical protein